jgi:hypothetical protein
MKQEPDNVENLFSEQNYRFTLCKEVIFVILIYYHNYFVDNYYNMICNKPFIS